MAATVEGEQRGREDNKGGRWHAHMARWRTAGHDAAGAEEGGKAEGGGGGGRRGGGRRQG
jgi:hypothetical protein